MSADSVAPEDLASSSNRHPFFQRSDSTTFLGCVSPDPIHTPLVQALPLAERPQLLHPLARREEMFGISKQPYNKNLVIACCYFIGNVDLLSILHVSNYMLLCWIGQPAHLYEDCQLLRVSKCLQL